MILCHIVVEDFQHVYFFLLVWDLPADISRLRSGSRVEVAAQEMLAVEDVFQRDIRISHHIGHRHEGCGTSDASRTVEVKPGIFG